jgi:type III secretion protein C
MKRCFYALLLLPFIAFAQTERTPPSPIPWQSQTVHVVVDGKDLKDVLHDFASSENVPATISADVRGTVTGKFDMAPQKFLDTMAATFGFVWYYDGNVLAVDSSDSVTAKAVKLEQASGADLERTLESLHIYSPRFPVTYDVSQGTALVTGPQQYVQLIADVAKQLDQTTAQRAGSVIRVFPLHHAWAADHTVEIDGKDTTVPGVASVLSSMYHKDQHENKQSGNGTNSGSGQPSVQKMTPMPDAAGGMSGGAPQSLNPPLPPSLGGGQNPMGLGGLMGGGSSGAAKGAGGASNGGGAQGDHADASDDLPIIVADARTNSVLIRDIPQRLASYGPIVEKLDKRPKLIEIETHIIEIDEDALSQIGIDWHAHTSHLDLQSSSGTTQQSTFTGNLNPEFGTTTLSGGTTVVNTGPVGGSLSAVIGSASEYLLARVDALEQNNLARIDATPKVATLDNVEAVIDYKTQFFVPVSGYTSADLYSVSAGVTLRVLPLVVENEGPTQIKLDVHIEDGEVTSQTVNNIPVITTSTINTEAFIKQGESLLVGGYRNDTLTKTTTGVPVLSSIPVIGALFRYQSKEDNRMERIFLMTPRILEF